MDVDDPSRPVETEVPHLPSVVFGMMLMDLSRIYVTLDGGCDLISNPRRIALLEGPIFENNERAEKAQRLREMGLVSCRLTELPRTFYKALTLLSPFPSSSSTLLTAAIRAVSRWWFGCVADILFVHVHSAYKSATTAIA